MTMTFHAELAPRRRPWWIALPLILVLLLGAVWTGVWFYAAREAETRMEAWRAQQARGGRVFACGSQAVGGYPFRIEVRCTNASAELRDAQPPLAIKLKEVLAVAQVWDPKLLIAEFTGPLAVSDPGQQPYALATWTLAQASVRGTPSAPERASIVVDGLKLEGATAGTALFDSKRTELHARVQFGSWPHNPAIDLAVKLAGATAPTVHPLMAQALDADILAVLHGMKDLTPKPMPVRLREWQAAGGRLEVQSARLAQGETLANATGTLALTQRGGLDGALRVAAAGIERFLPAIGAEPGSSLNLSRVAPALNAIDRAVPGLAQRVPPPKQQSLQAGLLALLGQPVEIEGKRGVAVPVRFNDGAVTLGPLPLGRVPPAF
jgi:hypothetical protein